MAEVCVITGGGSGMGLEVAKLMEGKKVVITGRTVAKLQNAVAEIEAADIDVEAFAADASKPESVAALVARAQELGEITTVIHAAGVSPHMDNAQAIFDINACGTINVDEAFGAVMNGGVILNVASMAGYMLPADHVPVPLYQASAMGPEALSAGFAQALQAIPAEQAAGSAYTISKNFVQWYTRREAVKLGKKGIRVVSISPGTFSTPMGNLEGEDASSLALNGALGRVGDPVEIARMMAFMVSDQASYLTGTDILYDGGVIASIEAQKEAAAAQQ